jgi:hypothetical protein
MFQASAESMRLASTACPIRGLTQLDWVMRQLLVLSCITSHLFDQIVLFVRYDFSPPPVVLI